MKYIFIYTIVAYSHAELCFAIYSAFYAFYQGFKDLHEKDGTRRNGRRTVHTGYCSHLRRSFWRQRLPWSGWVQARKVRTLQENSQIFSIICCFRNHSLNIPRFEKTSSSYPERHLYLPFGDGPRACVATRFAMQNIKIAVAKLLPKFKFTLGDQVSKILIFQAISEHSRALSSPESLNIIMIQHVHYFRTWGNELRIRLLRGCGLYKYLWPYCSIFEYIQYILEYFFILYPLLEYILDVRERYRHHHELKW